MTRFLERESIVEQNNRIVPVLAHVDLCVMHWIMNEFQDSISFIKKFSCPSLFNDV